MKTAPQRNGYHLRGGLNRDFDVGRHARLYPRINLGQQDASSEALDSVKYGGLRGNPFHLALNDQTGDGFHLNIHLEARAEFTDVSLIDVSVDDHTGQIGNRQHLGAAIESSGTGDSLPRRNWAGEDRNRREPGFGFFPAAPWPGRDPFEHARYCFAPNCNRFGCFRILPWLPGCLQKLSIVLKYASYLLELQLGCINLSLLLLDFNADVLVVQCKE